MYRRSVETATHRRRFEVAQDLQEEELPLFLLHLNVVTSYCYYWDHPDSVPRTDYSMAQVHLVAADPAPQSEG